MSKTDVRERDGCCIDCGIEHPRDDPDRALDVHHLDPDSDDDADMVTLCPQCHAKRHPELPRGFVLGRA